MKKVFLIAIAYGVLFLTGCATTTPGSQGAAVRATERLDLIVAGELLKAYEYLSPGYRSSVSPESYIADMVTRKVAWTGGELLGSECAENHCVIKFKVDYMVVSPVPGLRKFEFFDHFEEDWLFTQGQWWFVPEN